MVVGAAAVAGLFFVHTGDLTFASWLFVLALIGVAGSFVFYEALLPHIARGGELEERAGIRVVPLGGAESLGEEGAHARVGHAFDADAESQ